MTNVRWLPSFAPVTTITLAAILAVVLAGAAVVLALSVPWLGVELDRTYGGPGVRVERVLEKSPADGKLKSGDIISAFASPLHEKIEVNSFVILEDPDQLASYAEYNAFFALQQAVWEIISSKAFTVILSDERNVEITPTALPGPAVLSAVIWWLLFFGGASFVLGVSVWCLRREEPVARVLAISGTGFMLGAYSCGIYVTREIALPSNLFFAFASINHLGILAFAYSTILFFWYYPCRVGSGPAAWIFALGVSAIWLNETLQWWSWPIHSFYAHFLVAYCLLLFVTWMQWRKTRGVPLQRAMLKWLLATMLLSLGFTILLFYVPIIFTGKPIASTVLTFGAIFALYLGLVVGIIRYQQFEMHHWWFAAWQGLVFILIALFADALFFYLLNLTETASVGLAIGAGSMYLLVRQWFWGRFSGNGNKALDQALPHLVEVLMTRQQKIIPEQQWLQLIKQVFKPLSVHNKPQICNSVHIEQGGLALLLPSLDGLAAIEMFCCDRGKRLFGPKDINLVNRLLELMRHSQDINSARDQGVKDERNRIQRDLHDDVAARLLSLLHQTGEPVLRKVARNALQGLRDVINLLGAEEIQLEDVISDIEAESREQLGGLGIRFEWASPMIWPDLKLTSQQHINLRRIVREAIANAIKHAHPEVIDIGVEVDANNLYLRIGNDGAISEPAVWTLGRGVNNIKFRIAEMGGSHKWVIEQGESDKRYCIFTVSIPLVLNE